NPKAGTPAPRQARSPPHSPSRQPTAFQAAVPTYQAHLRTAANAVGPAIHRSEWALGAPLRLVAGRAHRHERALGSAQPYVWMPTSPQYAGQLPGSGSGLSSRGWMPPHVSTPDALGRT